jgi:hypothetical protein
MFSNGSAAWSLLEKLTPELQCAGHKIVPKISNENIGLLNSSRQNVDLFSGSLRQIFSADWIARKHIDLRKNIFFFLYK